MRTGAGLRVILHRESFFPFDTNTFYGLVIQIDVGDLNHSAILYILRTHFKAVILRGDLRLAGNEIFDRMIKAAVSMMHLVSPYT